MRVGGSGVAGRRRRMRRRRCRRRRLGVVVERDRWDAGHDRTAHDDDGRQRHDDDDDRARVERSIVGDRPRQLVVRRAHRRPRRATELRRLRGVEPDLGRQRRLAAAEPGPRRGGDRRRTTRGRVARLRRSGDRGGARSGRGHVGEPDPAPQSRQVEQRGVHRARGGADRRRRGRARARERRSVRASSRRRRVDARRAHGDRGIPLPRGPGARARWPHRGAGALEHGVGPARVADARVVRPRDRHVGARSLRARDEPAGRCRARRPADRLGRRRHLRHDDHGPRGGRVPAHRAAEAQGRRHRRVEQRVGRHGLHLRAVDARARAR